MFRLIGRAGYRVAWHLRKLWLRARGGTLHGCAVIARDEEGRVLLVRHSYGTRTWSFPGGGRKQGEDPAVAARREFAEELGCNLGPLRFVGHLDIPYQGATNAVDVFTALVDGSPRPDGVELTHAAFFARDALPHDLAKVAGLQLAMLD